MAENKSKQPEVTTVTESWLIENIKEIASQGTARQWNRYKHAALIARIAVEHGLPESSRNDFKASLNIHVALGGNESGFKQWAAKKGLIDKSESETEDYQ